MSHAVLAGHVVFLAPPLLLLRFEMLQHLNVPTTFQVIRCRTLGGKEDLGCRPNKAGEVDLRGNEIVPFWLGGGGGTHNG